MRKERKDFVVAITTISCRDPKWCYTKSLVAMQSWVSERGIRNRPAISFLNLADQCPLLIIGRQNLLLAALAMQGVTHICWIDDDVEWPKDLLDHICFEGSAVGVNIRRKDEKNYYTSAEDLEGKMLLSHEKHGLQEVSSVGLGIFCLDLRLIRDILPPHFATPHHDGQKCPEGEDKYFIRKLREAGVKVKVSHDASNLVGHCGNFIYRM